jgi:hypothetical protein
MATVHKLLADGQLIDITVPLDRREFQFRWIYALPSFAEWMKEVLPKLQTGRLNASETPEEQLDNILYKWITGKEIRYERMFKDLSPREDEVWEFKTADLRIFGWMVEKRKFVAVLGGYTDSYKPPNQKASYDAAKSKVISARNKLDLNEPKFISGVYDDIIGV